MVRMVAVSLTRPRPSIAARSSPTRAHVHARQRDIAAEDRLALALEAGAQRVRHGADAGDDHDAERHAGDEDAKAGKPAAQLARGDRRARSAAAGRRPPRAALSASVAVTRRAPPLALSTRPSAMRIVRSQAAASRSSCVTSIERRLAPPLQAEQQIDDLAARSCRRGCRSARRRE